MKNVSEPWKDRLLAMEENQKKLRVIDSYVIYITSFLLPAA
jgi:hypothetical protein